MRPAAMRTVLPATHRAKARFARPVRPPRRSSRPVPPDPPGHMTRGVRLLRPGTTGPQSPSPPAPPRPVPTRAHPRHSAPPDRPASHVRLTKLRCHQVRRHSRPMGLWAFGVPTVPTCQWRHRPDYDKAFGAIDPLSPTPLRGPPRPRCPRHSGAPRHPSSATSPSSAAPLATSPSPQASLSPHGPLGLRVPTHPMAPSGVLLEGKGATLRRWCRGSGVRCPTGPWL